MQISDTYRQIAQNPAYADTQKLRQITQKMLNRARVRIQTVEAKNARTSKYIAAKSRLQRAGLLTHGGNVSMSLPKNDRDKILTTLRNITNFLDVVDTTLRGQKKRKKQMAEIAKKKKLAEKLKREEAKMREKVRKEKAKKKSLKEKIEDEDKTEEDIEEEREEAEEENKNAEILDAELVDDDDGATIGDYWQIARDAGLFEFVPYEEMAEYIEDIYDKISITDFERIVIDVVTNQGNFWNYMVYYGVDIDD